MFDYTDCKHIEDYSIHTPASNKMPLDDNVPHHYMAASHDIHSKHTYETGLSSVADEHHQPGTRFRIPPMDLSGQKHSSE